MRVFYKGRKHRTKAIGEYDPISRTLIVRKGSIVSESIASFKGSSTVAKLRQEYVDASGCLTRDIQFATPSAAAAFVSGYSANGMLVWHIEQHVTLRDFHINIQGE